MSLLDRIADRIHAKGDAIAVTQGLVVEPLPGGRRRISHPDLPALLEARRRHGASYGLDLADLHILNLTSSGQRPRRSNRDSDRIAA